MPNPAVYREALSAAAIRPSVCLSVPCPWLKNDAFLWLPQNILLAIGEIALVTNMVKQTIIYVRCCAYSFRLFRCIFITFV